MHLGRNGDNGGLGSNPSDGRAVEGFLIEGNCSINFNSQLMLFAEGGPEVGVVAVCWEADLDEVKPIRADLLNPKTKLKYQLQIN